jgi:hypothetical protein
MAQDKKSKNGYNPKGLFGPEGFFAKSGANQTKANEKKKSAIQTRKVNQGAVASKKKTAVKGTMQGKQVDTTKGPNYGAPKAKPEAKKSTAPKTSVVNQATTGMKSEKTGPSYAKPKSKAKTSSVARGNETYNKGGSNLKSAPATKKRMEDKATAKKTGAKRRGPSGPSMTSFR